MWIVGEEFVLRSFTEHYKLTASKNKPYEGRYIFEHFEVMEYSTTHYSSSIHNILSRLLLLVKKAIEENKYLPKVIVIVQDDDVIKQLNIKKPSKEALSIPINYMLEELNRMIIDYKDKLEIKAKREFFPQVVWIAPPENRNFHNNQS